MPGPGYRSFVVTATTLNGDAWECPSCRRTTLIETVLETIATQMEVEVGSLCLLLGKRRLNPKSTLKEALVGKNTWLTILRKPDEDSGSDDGPPDLIDTSSEEPSPRLGGVRVRRIPALGAGLGVTLPLFDS